MTCACHEFEGEFRMPGPHGTMAEIVREAATLSWVQTEALAKQTLGRRAAEQAPDRQTTMVFE